MKPFSVKIAAGFTVSPSDCLTTGEITAAARECGIGDDINGENRLGVAGNEGVYSNRYRTRSKLRSLRAEIEAHEKEEDLRVIRNYMKKHEDEKPKKSGWTSAVSESLVLKEASLSHTLMDANGGMPSNLQLFMASPVMEDSKITRARKASERGKDRSLKNIPAKRCGNVHDQNEKVVSTAITLSEAKKGPRNELEKSTITNNRPIVIDIPHRTFPESIPIDNNFPLFYRKFPLCSYLEAELNK